MCDMKRQAVNKSSKCNFWNHCAFSISFLVWWPRRACSTCHTHGREIMSKQYPDSACMLDRIILCEALCPGGLVLGGNSVCLVCYNIYYILSRFIISLESCVSMSLPLGKQHICKSHIQRQGGSKFPFLPLYILQHATFLLFSKDLYYGWIII